MGNFFYSYTLFFNIGALWHIFLKSLMVYICQRELCEPFPLGKFNCGELFELFFSFEN